jgi:hypothetical protein
MLPASAGNQSTHQRCDTAGHLTAVVPCPEDVDPHGNQVLHSVAARSLSYNACCMEGNTEVSVGVQSSDVV